MFDVDTTYYINTKCISTENEQKSPYGKFAKSYVVVTYDGLGYNYYWTSVDETGHRIQRVASEKELNEDLIASGLKVSDIKEEYNVDDNPKYVIIDENCNKGEEKKVSDLTCTPDDDMSVTITSDRKPVMNVGDVVQIFSETHGFGDCFIGKYGWQYCENDYSPWIDGQ